MTKKGNGDISYQGKTFWGIVTGYNVYAACLGNTDSSLF